MKDKSTGFAGFLDGYKARNIAASAPSVTYHFDEMRNAVSGISASQKLKSASAELMESLQRLSSTMSDVQEDFISVAISCGEILKTILLVAKQKGDPSELLAEDKMKRLVYHYLEFAELSEDETVRNLAISIGEMF